MSLREMAGDKYSSIAIGGDRRLLVVVENGS
jgi:hypothetical protein